MEKNYGVVLGQRVTDWDNRRVGSDEIPYEVVNPSGNWELHLPVGEKQRNKIDDKMDCVTRSFTNSIEVQYKFKTGVERNFSDRFTATMSGTTKKGNYLWKVADSGMLDGLIDEHLYPTNTSMGWDEYYSPVPIELINKALEFKNDWQINYQFIDFNRESLIYHLKQAPIQVVVPGHAVLDFFTTKDVVKYFDSYEPFKKNYTGILCSACKIVLTKKNNDMYTLIRHPEKTGEVYALKGNVVRHIANFQTLQLGDKEPDRFWIWNKAEISIATASDWSKYIEADEIHLDPKD